MVYQKALLWQIHNAGILSVEGVMGMDLIMTATSNTMVSETVKIPVMDGTTERLPSAKPERKKGRWIYGEKSGQDGWYCSECGGFIPWDYDFYGLDNIDFIEDFKTCPFCDSKMVSYTGADMREGDSE